MKSFLYCEECDRPYPVREVEWDKFLGGPEGLQGVEFAEGDQRQRQLCGESHSLEKLWVISDYIVGEEWDPFKKIIYIVVDEKGIPMIVLGTRSGIRQSPVYTLYRPKKYRASLAIPDRLLYLVA